MQHQPEPPPERQRALLPRRHTVIVDGRVVYSGDDWQEAIRLWKEHGMNPANGYAEHRIDGRQTALWGRKPQ